MTVEAPAWPRDGLDQIKVVRELLARADAPVIPDAVATTCKSRTTAKHKSRVDTVSQTLVATGVVRQVEGGEGYFLPR